MSLSLRMGSLLNWLTQEWSGETGYSPSLVHILWCRGSQAWLETQKQKEKKKSETPKEYKCNNVLIFGSWSTQEKPEPERPHVSGHRIESE